MKFHMFICFDLFQKLCFVILEAKIMIPIFKGTDVGLSSF